MTKTISMALADLESRLSNEGVLLSVVQYDIALKLVDVLLDKIESYEGTNHPIGWPTPIEAIKFRMEQQGLRQRDVINIFGSRSHTSEVLNGKRPITLKMIRRAHDQLGIPFRELLPKREWL